jgi:endo-1,4-beta-D-glucanase Y
MYKSLVFLLLTTLLPFGDILGDAFRLPRSENFVSDQIVYKRIQNQRDANRWQSLVMATWQGYKDHYIFCGTDCGEGLVFDPSIEYQAVSEGVGYGLLMAVMIDDQRTFNVIFVAAEKTLRDAATGLFHWRADNSGNITGYGSATDADQDIALALIYAQHRVERGEWDPPETRSYAARANLLLDAIWLHDVVAERYVKPGDRYGGQGRDIINLSYFAPAWYRIFDDFQETARWQGLIETGYEALYATQGAPWGLAPDWSTLAGQPAFTYCDGKGIPGDNCMYEMRYDAIRVPWRIGLDCLWFGEERACEWTQRSVRFLNSLPDHRAARMYDMEGRTVVDYQDEAMVSMWLFAAVAAQDDNLQKQLENRLYDFGANAANNGHWGDSPHFYYKQSLAWFAAALLSGHFVDLSR